MTYQKRTREFKKHVNKIESLIQNGLSMYGFEAVCLVVGGVVNQDQNLGLLVGSDSTVDFFLEHYHCTDDTALGQLKSHVYDRLSKLLAQETTTDSAIQRERSTYSSGMVKKESTPSIAGDPPQSTAVPLPAELKERFIALTKRHGITITKGSSLLWRGFLQIVADAGYTLINWPEGVPFPCDETNKSSSSKGIAILKIPARILLLAALDHPTHPIALKKSSKSGSIPKNQPVIIGAPPDVNSPYAFGRRKFLDEGLTEDRKGPPRLQLSTARGAATAPQKVSTSSKKKNPSTSRRVESEAEESEAEELEESEPVEDSEVEVLDASILGVARPTSRQTSNSSSEESDDATPKAPKKGTASKIRPKVTFADAEFIEDDDDTPYCASQDGTAQYSGSDDDAPLQQRSPHRLRSKAQEIAGRKKDNRPVQKRQRRQAQNDDEAASVEKVEPKEKPSAATRPMSKDNRPVQKRQRRQAQDDDEAASVEKVEPKEKPSAATRPVSKGANESKATASAKATSFKTSDTAQPIKSKAPSRSTEHTRVDSVAEKLFGSVHEASKTATTSGESGIRKPASRSSDSELPPPSNAQSNSAARPIQSADLFCQCAPPSHLERDESTSSEITAPLPPFVQQAPSHITDHRAHAAPVHPSMGPEGYRTSNYGPMYMPESYSGRYGPTDHPSHSGQQWGMPPAPPGWYTSGPHINAGPAVPPPSSASNPAIPAGYYHGGYWPQGPPAYSGAGYGQYPGSSNVPPDHHAQDGMSRGNGQPGSYNQYPSTVTAPPDHHAQDNASREHGRPGSTA